MTARDRVLEGLDAASSVKRPDAPRRRNGNQPSAIRAEPGAMRSMLARSPVQSDLLMSLQASHGNSAVQELLSPVQREAAVVTRPTHHAPKKHRAPAHAAAQAGPKIENPTYTEAHDYARDYFSRQADKETILAELKDHAVQKFDKTTGKAYNTEAPGGLEILWDVLQIVPTAGPLLKTCGELKTGAKFFVTIEKQVEKLKKGAEIIEPFVKGREFVKKASEGTEEHEGAAYVVEKINSLDELRVADVAGRWDKEDALKKLLKAHKYDPPGVDLLGQISRQLGPIDDSSGLKTAAAEVRTKFELALYADFYRKQGAKFVIVTIMIVGEFLDGIPGPAKKYIMELGHFGSEREMASAFRLPILRDDEWRHREARPGEMA